MKKIVYSLFIALLMPAWLMAAGRIAEIWTQPAVFSADEQVTIYFDVTGTDLEGESNGIYLWAWYPSEPDANHWTNPSDFAALTKVDGNVWKMTMTPTTYFSKKATEISSFYGLLKNKDGSKVTDAFAPDQVPANDIRVYSLNAIQANDAVLDFYPKQFKPDRPLSILVNTNNTWSDCETTATKGKLAKATNVHVHGGVNNWATVVENNPANINKTKLTDMGNGIYRWDLVVNDYFGYPKGFDFKGINMVFANSDWSLMGKDVKCADFYIAAPKQEAVVIPVLNLFPQKISQKDILCIFRSNNEAYVSKLNYTITAGSKVITGDFEGSAKELIAYINLADQLKDAGSLEKIHLLIKDNTGRKVTEIDVPLVQFND
jgi:hypothetical protein